jgi:alkanesulfonate monooxygenase SsuD/methylene tetrahydromethanopterin reductase-like flavin-dependent oxidoreductase (luciferase family)
LDESLEILDGLWSGEPYSFEGEFHQVKEVIFVPKPLQQPRIPIWIGGGWDKRGPRQRAARWDGFFPLKWRGIISLEEWEIIKADIAAQREDSADFDFVQGGTTPGEDPARAREIVAPFEAIGLTWWIEKIDPWRFGLGWDDLMTDESVDKMNERIRQGPPAT